MKRGGGVEGLILIVSVIFFILALFIYMRKDDTSGSKSLEVANEARSLILSMQSTIDSKQASIEKLTTDLKGLDERFENFVHNMDLNREQEPLRISLAEPLKVSVVYRQSTLKTETIKNKSLLHRAGIIPRENN